MDIKQIKAFVAVYEEGSINKASVRLNCSQPSVSAAIKNLELSVSAILFERRSTGIVPTIAAETLYGHSRSILIELDIARKSLSGDLHQFRGPLRVGVAPTVAKGIIPGFLRDFLERYPEIELRLIEGFSGKLIEWTLAGEVDYSVIAYPTRDRRLTCQRIAVQPVVLISGVPGGRDPAARVNLLHEAPMKLALPWRSHGLRSTLDHFIDSHQIPVLRKIELDSLWGILDLVGSSDWCTLLPVSAAANLSDNFVIQEVEAPRMVTEFYRISPAREKMSARGQAFIDEIEKGFARAEANPG
jgi:LysR family transcriptional regulator, nitrogen assimilation regulatory protein